MEECEEGECEGVLQWKCEEREADSDSESDSESDGESDGESDSACAVRLLCDRYSVVVWCGEIRCGGMRVWKPKVVM